MIECWLLLLVLHKEEVGKACMLMWMRDFERQECLRGMWKWDADSGSFWKGFYTLVSCTKFLKEF